MVVTSCFFFYFYVRHRHAQTIIVQSVYTAIWRTTRGLHCGCLVKGQQPWFLEIYIIDCPTRDKTPNISLLICDPTRGNWFPALSLAPNEGQQP